MRSSRHSRIDLPLFDGEWFWNLKPTRVPGVAEPFNNKPDGFVKLSIEISYPDGQIMDRVYCRDFRDIKNGDFVFVTLQSSPSFRKQEKKQEDLQQVREVSQCTKEDHDIACRDYDLSRIKQALSDLELGLLSVGDRESQIEDEVAKLVQARTGELQEERARLTAEDTKLKSEAQKLQADKENFESRKREFEVLGGDRIVSVFKQDYVNSLDEKISTLATQGGVAETFVELVKEGLTAHNYIADDQLITQALLCLCVARLTGQFVVMTGPPGTGKTSLVTSMSKVLGAGYGVVPVRPSWIDPTDLLGFFDPRANRFHPTPFMDEFNRASKYSTSNRMFFLLLDEMNLARVENYAADFLAILEKAHVGDPSAALQLYSEEQSRKLHSEKEQKRQALINEPDGSHNEGELRLLIDHLERYPNRVPIPDGLIMFGSMNVDDTTHLPSPKFLDRALIIQIGETPLHSNIWLPGTTKRELNVASTLASDAVQAMVEGYVPNDKAIEGWKQIALWSQEYFVPLGIRTSKRLAQTFYYFLACADGLGIEDYSLIVSAFIQAKVLPGLSFRKDDSAIGKDSSKLEVLDGWIKSVGTYQSLKASLSRISTNNELIIRYLE